jgi:hypothetical protein
MTDTGEKKKELVMSLGAEKWVDFKESGENLIKDITAAADGQGPEAAVIAAGDVSLFLPQSHRRTNRSSKLKGETVQSSYHVLAR